MYKLKLATEKFKYLLDEIQNELINIYVQAPLHNESKLCNYLENVMLDYQDQILQIAQQIEKQHEKKVKTVKKILKPKLNMPIQYKSNEKFYKFKKGTTPWDFYLTNSCRRDMEKIDKELIESYCFKEPPQFTAIPENGTIVLGSTGTTLFRALCIEKISDSSCKLLNLDDGEILSTALNQIYVMPENLLKRPPQTVRCSLAKDRFCERFWVHEYSRFFKLIMECMDFTFEILDQLSLEYHPYYLIHLNGVLTTSHPKMTVDISRWFIDYLFPQMEVSSGDVKKVMKNVPILFFTNEDTQDLISSISSISSDFESQEEEIDISITSISELEEHDPYEILNISISSDSDDDLQIGSVNSSKSEIEENGILKFSCSYPLPIEDDMITVYPQTIIRGHIFYGHILDPPDQIYEEFKTLVSEINLSDNVQKFEHYDEMPVIKELCLALGENNEWCRSRVIDMDHRGIHVYHLDYGRFETVSLLNMRKISKQYLTLPPQGIRFELYGIIPIEDKRKDAENFTKKYLLNKAFFGIVKKRKHEDQTIFVSLLLPNQRSVEDVLVNLNFYETLPNLNIMKHFPNLQ